MEDGGGAGDTESSSSCLSFLFLQALPKKGIFKSDYLKSLAHSPASPEPELPLDCGV